MTITIPHPTSAGPRVYYTKLPDVGRDHAFVEVGAHTYCSGGLNVDYWGTDKRLLIGKYCSIAMNVVFFVGSDHKTDFVTTYPLVGLRHVSSKGDIIVGNDVWIANGARILSGVRIGDGAVVGNSTVVARDVPPYSIAVGNPMRVVRKRFDDAIIERLLALRWWDWPHEKVLRFANHLQSADVGSFLEMAERESSLDEPPKA